MCTLIPNLPALSLLQNTGQIASAVEKAMPWDAHEPAELEAGSWQH